MRTRGGRLFCSIVGLFVCPRNKPVSAPHTSSKQLCAALVDRLECFGRPRPSLLNYNTPGVGAARPCFSVPRYHTGEVSSFGCCLLWTLGVSGRSTLYTPLRSAGDHVRARSRRSDRCSVGARHTRARWAAPDRRRKSQKQHLDRRASKHQYPRERMTTRPPPRPSTHTLPKPHHTWVSEVRAFRACHQQPGATLGRREVLT